MDLTYRRQWRKKREDKGDQRQTRQSRGLLEKKHSLTLVLHKFVRVRLPSVCVLLHVCVSRWDFDGTVSNASNAATAGWQ